MHTGLFEDLELFNQKLADGWVKHNSLRPHKALVLQTTVQYIINHNTPARTPVSHMDKPDIFTALVRLFVIRIWVEIGLLINGCRERLDDCRYCRA